MMAAVKTFNVQAKLGEKFTIESKIGNHTLYVDQPQTGGGNDKGPTPMEVLLLALASCIMTVGRIIARQKRITLRTMEVNVEGDVDLEVLLGKSKANRAGYGGIKAIVTIDADMSPEEKKAFLVELEERCPVSDNLLHTTPLSLELAG
jgi:putative redox protein